MSYAIENALDQWEQGEQRVREEPRLEDAVTVVLEELRRRLGSAFEIGELAELYGSDTDWAHDLAGTRNAGTDISFAVDSAFNRYARQATDYSGGGRRLRARD